MNKEEIKFDMKEDIIFQIAMMSYNEYNDKIANANDHIGEVYSRQDIEEMEKCQLEYEKHLGELAIKQLQSQLTESNNKIKKIKEIINKRLKHNEDYIKTESEDANLLYILSIIDGSDE